MTKKTGIQLCLATVVGILLTIAQPSDSRGGAGGGHGGGGGHAGGGGGHVAVAHGGGGHSNGGHGGGIPIARGGFHGDDRHHHDNHGGYGYPAYYGSNYNNGDYRNYGGYPNCNSGSGVGAAIGSVVSGLLGAAHGHGYD